MNKSHDLRNSLRVLGNLDHLDPVRVNRSAYYLISFQRSSRWSISNKVPEWFLHKEDVKVVLLGLKKGINQHIVLANILQINT